MIGFRRSHLRQTGIYETHNQNLGIPNTSWCLPPNPDGSVDAIHIFGRAGLPRELAVGTRLLGPVHHDCKADPVDARLLVDQRADRFADFIVGRLLLPSLFLSICFLIRSTSRARPGAEPGAADVLDRLNRDLRDDRFAD